MLFHTQTSLEAPKGNCWQTAVACMLDLPIEALPAQADVERFPRYSNTLNGYLERHHNLMYMSLQPHEWQGVLKLYGHHPSGLYMWEGPTVRTPDNNTEHVVVAQGHIMLHDPHPSKAGLTLVKRWGILGPIPDNIREWRIKVRDTGDDRKFAEDLYCHCPECKPLPIHEVEPRVVGESGR